MNISKEAYKHIIKHVAMRLELSKYEIESISMDDEKRTYIMEIGVKFACCYIQEITGLSRGKVESDLVKEIERNEKKIEQQIKTLIS